MILDIIPPRARFICAKNSRLVSNCPNVVVLGIPINGERVGMLCFLCHKIILTTSCSSLVLDSTQMQVSCDLFKIRSVKLFSKAVWGNLSSSPCNWYNCGAKKSKARYNMNLDLVLAKKKSATFVRRNEQIEAKYQNFQWINGKVFSD